MLNSAKSVFIILDNLEEKYPKEIAIEDLRQIYIASPTEEAFQDELLRFIEWIECRDDRSRYALCVLDFEKEYGKLWKDNHEDLSM